MAEQKKMLNPRQAVFVAEYLKDFNGTQAAIRAGYSKRTANEQAVRLLADISIAAAVAAAKAERAARTQVDQDYVIEVITDTIARCRQAKPVLDKQGNPVLVELPDGTVAPAYTFDADAVLKGADLLAKHVGLFEKDNKQRAPLQELSDEALERVIARKQAELDQRVH